MACPVRVATPLPRISGGSPGRQAESRAWTAASAKRRAWAAWRLRAIPGFGAVTAMAVVAFAPAMGPVARGRDVAAWSGHVSRPHATGGRQKLGRTSKTSWTAQRVANGRLDRWRNHWHLRRLLIAGAMSVMHWRGRNGGRPGSWPACMLTRKPRMRADIALAPKAARNLRAHASAQWRMPGSGRRALLTAAAALAAMRGGRRPAGANDGHDPARDRPQL
ncbi:transposase [Mangrovicoccus ximenensis]|uniref:transposase n=1 Tax=Mangrovicoccus ximenensis TaxID=1911570 RepID=UPI0038B349EF